MINEINSELKRIEQEHNIKILYAIESGSRGWGFASKDSDFDVRFIYIRPWEDYLSVEDHKDFIEYPINNLLDINGWDIRKALKLYRKSNPPLLEWLSSPIVYLEVTSLAQQLRDLCNIYFSPIPSLHHYLSLAKGTMNEVSAVKEAKIKKYFYILRPLLACMWIEKYRSMAPMEFDKLRQGLNLSEALNLEIDKLLAKKLSGIESDPEALNPLLLDFFSEKIIYYDAYVKNLPKDIYAGYDNLNTLFRSILKEVWDKEL